MKAKDLKKGDLLYTIDKDNCFTVLEIIKISSCAYSLHGIPLYNISILDRLSSINSNLIIAKESNFKEVLCFVGRYRFVSCSEKAIINKLNELGSK